MTKEEKEVSLVNARRACLMLIEFAIGAAPAIILNHGQREEIASLLEEFSRLDAIERRQIEAGKKNGKLGAIHGKKGGRPKGSKVGKKKAKKKMATA